MSRLFLCAEREDLVVGEPDHENQLGVKNLFTLGFNDKIVFFLIDLISNIIRVMTIVTIVIWS